MYQCFLTLVLAVSSAFAPAVVPPLTIKDRSTAIVTLSDGSTITMLFSVTPDGSISAVGALGRDQWFQPPINAGVQPGPNPNPQPVPTPPTPPTPPVSKAAALIVIVDQAPPDPFWSTSTASAFLAGHNITPFVYPLSLVNDPTCNDVVALKWIGRSARSKGGGYPYAFIVDAKGVVLWEGNSLASDTDLVGLLAKYAGPPTTGPCPSCPAGTCPLQPPKLKPQGDAK